MDGRILIVDDNPDNLKLLERILRRDGHQVRGVSSGEEALAQVATGFPEIVLLDVTMPGMDGFEVCRRLKDDPTTADIPVLFISARPDMAAKLRGFDEGALDYITKPFEGQEVLARVRNHVQLYRTENALRASYAELRELEQLRDNLTHMIVHDMRSPLTAILGYLELARGASSDSVNSEAMQYLASATASARLLTEMISSLLDITRLESSQMPLERSLGDLRAVTAAALDSLGVLVTRCTVVYEQPQEPVTAWCDPEITRRIVMNLVGNALKFTPPEGEVRIELRSFADHVRAMVTDTGPGIPRKYHRKIFEKFGQVGIRGEKRKYSTGLGLTFCKLAVEAQGGQIGVDSAPGEGSRFWFTLPGAAPPERD